MTPDRMSHDARRKVTITDVTLTIFRWTGLTPVTYTRQGTPPKGESHIGLVAIHTDAGVTGHSFLGSSFRPVDSDANGFIEILKPAILGENALDRDRLNRLLMIKARAVMLRTIGAVDVALWDIAGKIAGLPVCDLLGRAKAQIPAYASSSTLPSIEAYVDQALEVKAQGYRGYKMHPPHDMALHVPMLEKVRAAVGDEFPLMYDPAMIYTYPEAVRIGRVLERTGYLWFEDPLPVDDMYNYQKLCADLDVAVMATEYSHGGFPGYAPWISMKATDALRGDVAIKGGFTPCLKAAHLAEAFHMNFEIHHGGNSMNNVANLHLALAIPNCSFFEVLLPHSAQKYGLVKDLEIDQDGCLAPSLAPGLGAEIDFDLIKSQCVAVLE
jgi:L-alanine-DL-glutamate epimerase-like enolase superfamily enzyme